ncbi:aspartate/glutamate racemase family protein [Salinarimonas sp. NSM]|uniref:aspartate/glutamate racemase family protein n=1 Tax=Salinarimonas sp. NSM TaxID=3458003 RepID=UPI0040354588
MSTDARILVVNPNSNEAVTAGLAEALAGYALPGGPRIDCLTLAEGPFNIETQADIESVVLPLARLVAREKPAATVIACFSDPGVQVCREATRAPVFGMREAGILAALARADRFGIIAVQTRSIRRHLRAVREIGVGERLAGDRALEITVAQAASDTGAFARLVEVGRTLRDLDGAEALVLGCAGMARHRAPLEAELGVPVIDPVQAAVGMALATLLAR